MIEPLEATGRPPIVAEYPNGMLKLFCPCAAVLTFKREAVPPTQCAFCGRRYHWPEPVVEPAPSPAAVVTCSSVVLPREPLDDAAERKRTYVKARGGDYAQLRGFSPVLYEQESPAVLAIPRNPSDVRQVRIRSTKRMCVRCCRVSKPAPPHEVLRAARGGAAPCWIWLCDQCLPIYEARGVIAEYARPNNWNIVKEAAS